VRAVNKLSDAPAPSGKAIAVTVTATPQQVEICLARPNLLFLHLGTFL
jgi:hypothetical protein